MAPAHYHLLFLQLPMALVEPTRPIQFPMGVSARCFLGLYYRCFGHSILSYQWLSRIITYWFFSYQWLSCNQPGPYSIQWEFVHAVFSVCITSQVRSALVKGNSVILLFQAFAYLVRRNLDRFRSPRITLLFRSGHSAGISAVLVCWFTLRTLVLAHLQSVSGQVVQVGQVVYFK